MNTIQKYPWILNYFFTNNFPNISESRAYDGIGKQSPVIPDESAGGELFALQEIFLRAYQLLHSAHKCNIPTCKKSPRV